MTPTYTWLIEAIDTPVTTESGTTANIHWRCVGTDGTHQGQVYATLVCPYTPPAVGAALALADVIGWLQTALTAEGVAAIQAAIDAQIAAAASPPVVPVLTWNQPPALTAEQIAAQTEAAYESGVQGWLDAGAQAWKYESILSAASYVASTNAQFKAEAAALIGWRDAVWTSCYAALSAVQAGTTAMPTSLTAFIATLPAQPTRPS